MIFRTREEAEKKLKEYFEETPVMTWTITGVCLHCGMTKETFYQYCKKEDFSDLFNNARLRVEHSYELSLRENGRAGDIFALKNFGWSDKQEVEMSGGLNLTIEDQLAKLIEGDEDK